MLEKVCNSLRSNMFPIKNMDKVLTPNPTSDPTHELAVFDTSKLMKKSKQKYLY